MDTASLFRDPRGFAHARERHASVVLTFAGLASGDAAAAAGGRIGEISQTTLAIAEGAIRGWIRFRNGKQPLAQDQFRRALLRWGVGQGLELQPDTKELASVHGWLS